MILRFKTTSLFICALISTAALTHADLLVHYGLDEADGTAAPAADSIGTNSATVIGGAGNVTKGFASPKAYLGTAYDFALRGGLDIGATAETRPTDQWTMTWWMRPTTLDAFDRIYESLSGTGNDGNGIRVDLGGSPGNRMRVLLRDGNGATSTTLSHSQALSVGSWYFCAVRYDSTEGNGAALKITILPASGGNISTGDVSGATENAANLGTGPIAIHGQGAFLAADDGGAAGSNDFGGALDDFAIFQTGDAFGVLTDADIAQVHNIGALAFDPPAPPPTIQNFAASPASVASGTTVTLSWNVTDADSVVITPDIGTVANSGSTTVTATTTRVYTLTATNAEGNSSATTQITVDGLPLAPRLSEFVASNGGSLLDGDGNSSDWIEIHNPNATAFDLSGYHLSDDPLALNKWAFPAGTIIAPGEYLVVFASGQATATYTDAAGNLHTNFSLSASGELLAFIAPDGSTILQQFDPYPAQERDVSYGTNGYFTTTTPGAANNTSVLGFVEDTKFSIDRGFYDAPISVAITTATAGAEIYTTTDGSEPTPTNGTLYSGPISVSTTTVLRAAAFLNGYAPTNTDTHTYLYLDDVLTQPNNPPGWPTTFAGKLADYEMDPDIVNSPDYSAEMLPAMRKFATLSVAIEPDDFSGTQGIYQNPQSEGPLWERAVSAELMTHDGSEPGFQINAGLRVQGGSSRNPDTPKHSMSLRFRAEYGAGKLRYDLLENAPDGDNATNEFDFLQLRSGYNYGWVHRHWYQGEYAQYNRDQFANDLFVSMGNFGTHGRWVHLYLNGIYWGIYHIHERPDSNYMASYFGGDNADYDAINSNVATDGTVAAYNAMAAKAANNIADPNNYQALKSDLDISSFIDYMLMNFYVGNQDWDGHNWRAAGGGTSGLPFHFFPWDTEISISPFGGGRFDPPTPVEQSLTSNVTGKNGNNRPTGIHQDLTTNEEYRLQFADHVRRHMFNGGVLTPAGADAIWTHRSDDMDLGIVAESARWGDYRRDVETAASWSPSDYDLFSRDDHYLSHQNWILGTYLPQRTDIVIGQLRARDLYPDVDAPDYAQHGGQVASGFSLGMTHPNASGVIYYTLDGSDPRQPATAANDVILLDQGAAATALVQQSDGGLGTSWTQTGFDDSSWKSGVSGVGFETTPGTYDPLTGLYVPEMRSSSPANASCLIRVPFNIPDQTTLNSIATLTLNMKYDDGYGAYLNGVFVGGKNNPAPLTWNSSATTGHSDSLAVIFEPLDISAAIPNLTVGANVLAIHGLNVTATSSDFVIVPQLVYATNASSGVSPSAMVYSSAVTLPASGIVNARVRENGEWSALNSASFIVGTPAAAGNLVVSEIFYNPIGADESGEFIELTNISANAIQLGGVRFSEGIDYTFPVGTELAPGAFLVLSPADYTGSLDNTGEMITLLDANGTVIESFTYNDKTPWPEAPDGDGHSLVRIAPDLILDPNLPSSWRSSTLPGGNPGTTDATNCPPGVDLLDYAMGPDQGISVGIGSTSGDVFAIDYPRNLSADDIIYTVEVSTDLINWSSGAGFVEVSNETIPSAGTTRITVDSLVSSSAAPRQYLRLRVTKR